jgi:hypothetical protein
VTVTMGRLNEAIATTRKLVTLAPTDSTLFATQQVLAVLERLRQDRIDRATEAARSIIAFANEEPDLWRIFLHAHHETAAALRAAIGEP